MTDSEKALAQFDYMLKVMNDNPTMGANHVLTYELYLRAKQLLENGTSETIRTVLKSQEKPVEVTVQEFNDLIDPQMPSFNNIGNLLLNRFPNGIKLIEGADHGS